MFERSTLPNGLRVLTSNVPYALSVTVAFLFGAGSRYESDAQGGAFHFVEHLCFKGTRRRPTPQEISRTIEGLGGYMNGSTDQELTSYWCKVARPHLATAVDLLADMVREPLFAPEEVERERGVILEELAMTRDHPDQEVELLIDELLWPDQPLGRDAGGTPESVQGISREALLSCMARQYVPSNAVLAVAGDVSHQEVLELLGRELHTWPAGQPLTWSPAQDGQEAPRARLKRRQSKQAHLCLAVRGLPAAHPQRYALDLLSLMLGDGMSSRLFLELRERQGLVYAVSSMASHYRDTGSMVIYAATDPRKGLRALRSILGELAKLKTDPLEEELTRAKETVKGRLLLRLEDTRYMAFWLGSQEQLLGKVWTVEETVARVEAVTPEEVQALARSLIVPDRLSLAVVGPYRSFTSFERLLGA
jgi:predicted Zn-dependent peptidase